MHSVTDLENVTGIGCEVLQLSQEDSHHWWEFPNLAAVLITLEGDRKLSKGAQLEVYGSKECDKQEEIDSHFHSVFSVA